MIPAALQTSAATGIGAFLAKPLGFHPLIGATAACVVSITSLALKKFLPQEGVTKNNLKNLSQLKPSPTIKHSFLSTIAILAGAKLGQLAAMLYGKKTSISYESSLLQAWMVASFASKLSGRKLYSICLSGGAGALIARGIGVKPLLGFFIGNTTALARFAMTHFSLLQLPQERNLTDEIKARVLKTFSTLLCTKILHLIVQRLGSNASFLQMYAAASIARKLSRPFGSLVKEDEPLVKVDKPATRERGSSDPELVAGTPEGTARRLSAVPPQIREMHYQPSTQKKGDVK
jgi:hypothetical protein